MRHFDRYRRMAFGALLLVLLACGTREDQQPDDLSSTIISVDTVPSLVIPSMATDDSVNFGSVRSITPLSNGQLAVLDRSSRTIRIFAADGKQVAEFGRNGAGPGEFKFPIWIGECLPDTLLVIDANLGRLSLFDLTGRFVRSHDHTYGDAASVCNQRGQIIGMYASSSDGMPTAQSPLYSGTITRVNIGGLAQVLDTVPLYYNRPMGRLTYLAVSDGVMFVGRADSAFVEKRDLSGNTLARFPLGRTGVAPSTAQYAAEVEVMLRMLSRPEDRVRPREILMKVEAPASMPAFRALFADPSGAVWAVTSPAGDSVTILEGLDSLGQRFAPMHLPGDLDIRAVGRDHIVAIAEDADGTQRILMFRLTRR